jgi:hypothetical protein
MHEMDTRSLELKSAANLEDALSIAMIWRVRRRWRDYQRLNTAP